MRAIDTNVLVRALVQDDPAQAARAIAMLGIRRQRDCGYHPDDL